MPCDAGLPFMIFALYFCAEASAEPHGHVLYKNLLWDTMSLELLLMSSNILLSQSPDIPLRFHWWFGPWP